MQKLHFGSNRRVASDKQNTSAPQKFVASKIGKSERTVKSITAHLTKQGIVRRYKGKGSLWEIFGG